MSGKYILDETGTPVLEPDVVKWARWFEKSATERVVLSAEVNGVLISTVFLGLDHNFGESGPPLLYETMVFGGEHDGECERYPTAETAREGHHRMVARIWLPS